MQKKNFDQVFILMQIAVVTVFVGRAWQHLYWDAPYRVLLWDEMWMKPLVEGIIGWKWEDYVTSLAVDRGIQRFIQVIGVFYIICALAGIFIRQWKRVAIVILWIGGFSLLFLAILYSKDKFFHLGQFLEYALQWSAPIFLLFMYQQQQVSRPLLFAMKTAIAATFICHGLYAVGYYPRPGDFMQMTMAIMKVDETGAAQFLKIAGILDFIGGILLFVPGKIGKLALLYCVAWGFITSIARILAAQVFGTSFENMLLQTVHESLYRFPHFLIPLVVWLALNRQNLRDTQ